MIETWFAAELEKLAVSVTDLEERVKRAPGVTYDGTGQLDAVTAARGGGGLTLPRRDVGAKKLNDAIAPMERFVGKLPSWGGVRDNAQRGVEGYKRAVKGMFVLPPAAAGHIFVDSKQVANTFRVGPSDDARRALGAVTGAHELAERRVRPRDAVTGYYSHNSPDVLLKEHNTLSRLEGPGSDEARTALRGFRSATGEADNLRTIVERTVKDPRAQQFLDEGQKVPKAMRKHILAKIRENPSVVSPTMAQRLKLTQKVMEPAIEEGRKLSGETVSKLLRLVRR